MFHLFPQKLYEVVERGGGGKEGERKKLSLIGKVFKLGIDFACIIDKIPH